MANDKTPNPAFDELNLSPEIIALAAKFEKQFKVGDGGQIQTDKELYASTLPEGLTMEQVTAVQKHDHNVASAATLALIHVGTKYLAKHKDAKTVEVSIAAGKDRFEAVYDRSKEYPGGKDAKLLPTGEREKVTKYGVVTPSWTVNGAVGNRGVMKKIRAYGNEHARAALAAE